MTNGAALCTHNGDVVALSPVKEWDTFRRGRAHPAIKTLNGIGAHGHPRGQGRPTGAGRMIETLTNLGRFAILAAATFLVVIGLHYAIGGTVHMGAQAAEKPKAEATGGTCHPPRRQKAHQRRPQRLLRPLRRSPSARPPRSRCPAQSRSTARWRAAWTRTCCAARQGWRSDRRHPRSIAVPRRFARPPSLVMARRKPSPVDGWRT